MNRTVIKKDLDKAMLTIERCFNAPRSRVWQAYTDPALLDQWWAPNPWKAETLAMDFRVGGHWHYAMHGPEGERHFGRADFLEIVPEQRFAAVDAFADATGEVVKGMPKQTFVNSFTDEDESTRVTVEVRYESVEDLEKIIEMGMEEGVSAAQDQLEELLESG